MRQLAGDDYALLAYLVLLLLVVGGSMIISSRSQLNKSLQQGAIWGLIFVGVIGAYSVRDRVEASLYPARPMITERGSVRFNRARDGHFYANVVVNGKKIEFIIDTGATDIVLTEADAARLGYPSSKLVFSGQASTANGVVPIARITLDSITLGRFTDRNVSATVNGGALDTSLLGMRYLGRYQKIEIAGATLTLTR